MTAFALHRRRPLVLGLLLFAFTLRLQRVTWVPLIIDEAKTIIRYVALSLSEIFNGEPYPDGLIVLEDWQR